MFLDGKRCFSLISVVHYSHSVVHCAYYDNSVANTFAIEPLPIDANLLKAFDISSFRIPKDLPYQPHPLVCPPSPSCLEMQPNKERPHRLQI